ncbi:MAG TPA: SRPBCC domain-containing protein [Polyangiaceae bacterium]|nr:SRPBCC domain-containing protein [Polyangiaceae bacterium]
MVASTKAIRIFQNIPVRPSRLFQALTDPKDLAAWHADVVRGKCEVGGSLELSWPRLGVEIQAAVREVLPGKRVSLESSLGRIVMSIVPGGVELVHHGRFDADERAGSESAWRVSLSLLATYLTRHVDRPRRVHWCLAPVRASAELCHAYFTERELVSRWLGRMESSLGEAGSGVHCTLNSGRRLSGPVLSNTPGRDVALRWREADDSVLSLRTLRGSPDEGQARYLLVGWSRWGDLPEAATLAREIDEASERLRRELDRLAFA